MLSWKDRMGGCHYVDGPWKLISGHSWTIHSYTRQLNPGRKKLIFPLKITNYYAPINCLPHLLHLGQRWAGSTRRVVGVWHCQIWPEGWGKCHMHLSSCHADNSSCHLCCELEDLNHSINLGICQCWSLPGVGPVRLKCVKSPPIPHLCPRWDRWGKQLIGALAYYPWKQLSRHFWPQRLSPSNTKGLLYKSLMNYSMNAMPMWHP